jgi:hypothetical protein
MMIKLLRLQSDLGDGCHHEKSVVPIKMARSS